MRSLLEISAILVLIVANGVLAMSETAVVTARRSRLTRQADKGDERARDAAALKDQPTAFLSAVQIGITLVGILAGALGGGRLASRLAEPFARIGWLASYADTLAFVIVVGVITYLSLVLGELVPKRIALANPEGVASRVARPMQRLAAATRPIVAVLSASTNAVARVFGIRSEQQPGVTEEDVRALIAQAARTGVLHETEEDILERVFYLGDRQVSAVMVPRPDVDWIEPSAPAEALREMVQRHPHRSHLLVCEGDVDHVRGVVSAAELFSQCLTGTALNVPAVMRQPMFVPASMPVLQLLQRFRQSDIHLAVALDEFGSVEGIVTLNDILADLVANIPGRMGSRESDIVRRDDGSWLIDGTVPLQDVEQALGTTISRDDRSRSARTLGGLVLDQLGHVPAEGESFQLGDLRFEVADMDGRRVDRVIVGPADRAAAAPVRPDPPPV